MNRADLMRQALRSGNWRSRHDIFNDAGQFFLTNNAASELRAQGFTVEQRRSKGQFQYRLLDRAECVAGEKTGDETASPHAQEASALRFVEQAALPTAGKPLPPAACSPFQLELETESRFGSGLGESYASSESRAA